MKILRLAVLLSMTATPAHAMDAWLSVGQTAPSYGTGVSMAVGIKGDAPIGLQLGFAGKSELDEELLDYPVPHNNYTSMGTLQTGTAMGADVLWFLPETDFDGTLPAGSALRTYLGLGGYYMQRADVAKSNATGWYYTQDDRSSLLGAAELGLQFRTASGFIIGGEYHLIRGGSVSVGMRF